MLRTHDAGALRATDAGSTVTLAGWVARRRDHGGVVFLDLRDASGYAQVVVREEEAHALRNEYCVLVTGEVQRRPAGNENPELPTGDIEVVAATLEVLSSSAPLPFPIETSQPAGDDVRYKYRYLDLRRQGPASVLRLRSEINRVARGVMDRHGFVEVETPNLTRSTPEGARDFVVPVRLQPGSWYALPQSPQLFKQLLMIGGLERYYQIARAFRDEDFRADRQPEFTQLDFEMSFVDRDDVLAIAEDVVRSLWAELASYEVP
ncbi:MAG: aspS, partial [Modestobacter sp.]|nr:aspS [Modestobacter sp.]